MTKRGACECVSVEKGGSLSTLHSKSKYFPFPPNSFHNYVPLPVPIKGERANRQVFVVSE